MDNAADALDLIVEAKVGADHLRDAIGASRAATEWIVSATESDDWLAAATPYLDLRALTVAGGPFAGQIFHVNARPCDQADRLVL